MYNLFVLVQNSDKVEILLGKAYHHRDLLSSSTYSKCLGGGFYCINDTNKTIILYGSSHDYHYPQFGDNIIDKKYEGYAIYYLPDLGLPLDDIYKIKVNFV